jgi:hypothetical protein
MMPSFASSFLKVVATETESKTASTATPAQPLLLLERDAELVERLEELGSTSSRLSCFFCFGAE